MAAVFMAALGRGATGQSADATRQLPPLLHNAEYRVGWRSTAYVSYCLPASDVLPFDARQDLAAISAQGVSGSEHAL